MFKNKRRIFGIILILTLLSATIILWAQQQYYPEQAVKVAKSFINYIIDDDLKQAYQLTTKQSRFKQFDSFEQFQVIVNQNWFRDDQVRKITSIKIREIFPFQSNGNRIRRWLSGQAIEMPQVSVDFIIEDSHGNILPFEVREVYLGEGKWGIAYFQSHAL